MMGFFFNTDTEKEMTYDSKLIIVMNEEKRKRRLNQTSSMVSDPRLCQVSSNLKEYKKKSFFDRVILRKKFVSLFKL